MLLEEIRTFPDSPKRLLLTLHVYVRVCVTVSLSDGRKFHRYLQVDCLLSDNPQSPNRNYVIELR